MKKLLSLTLASLLALSMFAGCSQTPADDSANNTDDSNVSSNTDDSVKTMTFINGELEIPTDFSNFAVLNYGLLDQFIALDAAPNYSDITSTITDETDESTISFIGELTNAYGVEGFDISTVEMIERNSDNKFEQLLAFEPDFIVMPESYTRDMAKYESIAPVYVIPAVYDIPEGSALWKEELRFVGEFLGKSELAEEKIATYDTLVEESRALISDTAAGKTALVLQLNEKGFKIRMPEDQAHVYADIGFEIPESLTSDFNSGGESNADGSFGVETIIEFNPDYIFIQNQSHEAYNDLVGTPIWDNIQAVKDGRVYEISQSAWNFISGYNGMTYRIENLVHFVMEDTQTIDYTPIVD